MGQVETGPEVEFSRAELSKLLGVVREVGPGYGALAQLLPPAEEDAEEAYGYGYAVDTDPEDELALGHSLEGEGFLVHGYIFANKH